MTLHQIITTGDETPSSRSAPTLQTTPQNDLMPPAGTWDAIFRAHRWVLWRDGATYESLWEASQAHRDVVWRDARHVIAAGVDKDPDPGAPANLHPAWFVHALRNAHSPAQLTSVVTGLERLWMRRPADFVAWAAQLVAVTTLQEDKVAVAALTGPEGLQDEGLLYEVVLAEVQKHDDTWEGLAPPPSVRLAAMLDYHLREKPLAWEISHAGHWAFWQEFITHRRACWDSWMHSMPPAKPAFRVVMVPGESIPDRRYINDSAAEHPSRERALNAVAALRWHAAACPADSVVVVVLSGGQVRSERSEASFMATALRDPSSWGGEPMPSQLHLIEDGMSRHTSNNLRASAQLAMRLGLDNFWVQTTWDQAYFSLLTDWRERYRTETTWGLSAAERAQLDLIRPMVRRPCGPGANQNAGRARYGTLRSMVFVPAIGDALNP